MEFKVGDRVRIYDFGRARDDKLGTVVHTEFSQTGVRHDDYIGGHDCNNNCPQGYGWYYFAYNLELIKYSTDTLILLL